jgi:hypothetical protein
LIGAPWSVKEMKVKRVLIKKVKLFNKMSRFASALADACGGYLSTQIGDA